jgi:DNA helicase TIP49 (TBP-interacting protein)
MKPGMYDINEAVRLADELRNKALDVQAYLSEILDTDAQKAAIGYMIMAAEQVALPTRTIEKLIEGMNRQMAEQLESDALEAYARYEDEAEVELAAADNQREFVFEHN